VTLAKPIGGPAGPPGYFCQVRFLWRFARSFLRRLCLLIFALRRFFNEPINNICIPADRLHANRGAHLCLPAALGGDQPIASITIACGIIALPSRQFDTDRTRGPPPPLRHPPARSARFPAAADRTGCPAVVKLSLAASRLPARASWPGSARAWIHGLAQYLLVPSNFNTCPAAGVLMPMAAAEILTLKTAFQTTKHTKNEPLTTP